MPDSQCTKISLDQADQFEDPADYETFLQYAEEYKASDKVVSDFFWFTIPEDYWFNEGDYLKYEFTCEGENVEVYVNGNPMEIVQVDGNDYYANLTEFGALGILIDA